MLKINLTNASGDVFEILEQNAAGEWRDSAGDLVAEDLRALIHFHLPELLAEALVWAKANS